MQVGDKVKTTELYKYIKWRLHRSKVNPIINGTIVSIKHMGNMEYPFLATVKDCDGTIQELNIAHLELVKEETN